MSTQATPDGFHTISPYFAVQGPLRLIEFFKDAFDAREVFSHNQPDGILVTAGMMIGDSMVLIGNAPPEFAPMPAMLYMYLADVDATYAQAVKAGGKSIHSPSDQGYGDRRATIEDPAGNQWWMATRMRKNDA